MITVVTLNPCVDKTVVLEQFKYGETNRVLNSRTDIGGKGINVSLVLKELKTCSTNLLIDYTVGNNTVSDLLNKNGINTVAIKNSSSLRTNLKIIDNSTSSMTEINESGLSVSEDIITQLWSEFNEMIVKTDLLVLSGSVPPGVDNGIYKRMIQLASSNNIRTVLDTSATPFSVALDSAPYLIKPNRQELSEYTGSYIFTEADIINAAKILLKKGIEFVCVSDGEKGAYLISKEKVLFSNGAKIAVKSPQGAGDSMVASFAKSIIENETMEEMLINAVAAAQATVMREGTQLCAAEDFIKLKSQIKLKTIDNTLTS